MSCMIWANINSKGGTGKTTLTAILASEIVRLGGTVALVDSDPNQPLKRWHDALPNTKQISVLVDADQSGDTLAETITRAKERADFVLVDTEGSENNRMAMLPYLAEMMLLPIQLSKLDLVEAQKVESYLQKVSANSKTFVPRIIVPTRVSAAIRTKTETVLRAELANTGLPVLDPPILDKDAFKQMFTQGKLLHELPPSSGIKSAQENARAAFEGLARTYTSIVKSQHENAQPAHA